MPSDNSGVGLIEVALKAGFHQLAYSLLVMFSASAMILLLPEDDFQADVVEWGLTGLIGIAIGFIVLGYFRQRGDASSKGASPTA